MILTTSPAGWQFVNRNCSCPEMPLLDWTAAKTSISISIIFISVNPLNFFGQSGLMTRFGSGCVQTFLLLFVRRRPAIVYLTSLIMQCVHRDRPVVNKAMML